MKLKFRKIEWLYAITVIRRKVSNNKLIVITKNNKVEFVSFLNRTMFFVSLQTLFSSLFLWIITTKIINSHSFVSILLLINLLNYIRSFFTYNPLLYFYQHLRCRLPLFSTITMYL